MKYTVTLGSAIYVAILAFVAFNQTTIPPSWHMINVNYGRLQGDANLIINDDSITMIDAGYREEADKMVVPYLEKLEIDTINHFFISHPHKDHYQGMEAIQNAGIIIENVYFSMPPEDINDCCYSKQHFIKYLSAAKDRGAILHEVKTGFKLHYPNKSFIEVLYVHDTSKINSQNVDVNDLSLVLKWYVNDVTVLFPGDLNSKVGEYLSNDIRMKSDVLKTPHHGLSGIAPDSFFDRVAPDLNMVPGRKHDWLSDRGAQVKEWTERNNIPTCINGVHGTIVVRFDKYISIQSENPDDLCPNGDLTRRPIIAP